MSGLAEDERRRVAILRFPLAFGVVLLHTLGMTVAYAGYLASAGGRRPVERSFMNVMIVDVLSRESRALFFAIAALLLVAGLGPHMEGFGTKLRHRWRTLAIPYVLWNVGALAFCAAMAWMLPHAGISGSGFTVKQPNGFTTFAVAFGLTGNPVDYPMWFVRNLIVLVLLSPMLIAVARRAPWLLLLIFATLCFCREDKLFMSTDSLLFFAVGLVAGGRPTVLACAKRQGAAAVALYAAGSVLDGLLIFSGHRIWAIHVSVLVLGLPALWVVAGCVQRRPKLESPLLWLSTFSFLLFVAHGPITAVVQRVLIRALPLSGSGVLDLLGIAGALIVAAIVVGLGVPFHRYLPKTYAFFTGGRTPGAIPVLRPRHAASE